MLAVYLQHCLTAIVRHGQGAKAELHEIRIYVQQVTIDKQFVKVLAH